MKRRLFRVLYIIWGAINFTYLIIALHWRGYRLLDYESTWYWTGKEWYATYVSVVDRIYPFIYDEIMYYDLSEFIAYMILPLMFLWLYRYVRHGTVKRFWI